MNTNQYFINNQRAGYAVTLFLPADLVVVYTGNDGEYKDLTALACSLIVRGINTRVVEEVTNVIDYKEDDELIGGVGFLVDETISNRNVDQAVEDVVVLVAALHVDQVERLNATEAVALIADGVRDAMLSSDEG